MAFGTLKHIHRHGMHHTLSQSHSRAALVFMALRDGTVRADSTLLTRHTTSTISRSAGRRKRSVAKRASRARESMYRESTHAHDHTHADMRYATQQLSAAASMSYHKPKRPSPSPVALADGALVPGVPATPHTVFGSSPCAREAPNDVSSFAVAPWPAVSA